MATELVFQPQVRAAYAGVLAARDPTFAAAPDVAVEPSPREVAIGALTAMVKLI